MLRTRNTYVYRTLSHPCMYPPPLHMHTHAHTHNTYFAGLGSVDHLVPSEPMCALWTMLVGLLITAALFLLKQ